MYGCIGQPSQDNYVLIDALITKDYSKMDKQYILHAPKLDS